MLVTPFWLGLERLPFINFLQPRKIVEILAGMYMMCRSGTHKRFRQARTA
jgi:hypothetical protein